MAAQLLIEIIEELPNFNKQICCDRSNTKMDTVNDLDSF